MVEIGLLGFESRSQHRSDVVIRDADEENKSS